MAPLFQEQEMTWIDVERNAQKQKKMFAHQTEGRAQIKTYYPELHTGKLSGDFINTSGGPIVADLITAPHLIVDLYPFENELEMIKTLGVDGAFLRSLRDRSLITIMVNADLARFKNLEWLFDILADDRTVHRSTRTPLFLEAVSPGIFGERELLETYLEKRFREMDSVTSRMYLEHVMHYQKPTPESLAAQLSWEWVRVNGLGRLLPSEEVSASTYSVDDILRQPSTFLPIMYRDSLVLVSPHSTALGGTMRVPRRVMVKLFGETANDPDIVDFTYFEELHQFLLAIECKVEDTQITGEQYWAGLNRIPRHELLNLLANNEERKKLIQVERSLRTRIARMDENLRREEIHDLVYNDIRLIKKFWPLGNFAYNSVCTTFGAAIDHYMAWSGGIAGGIGGLATGITTGKVLKGSLAKSKAKAALEFFFPRLQVANFVTERRDGK
jgi:hypothetical protein